MISQEIILAAIRAERKRQDLKWGPEHDPGDAVMLAVLLEEAGEVARELNEPWPQPRVNVSRLRVELVQVAAVCVKWIEMLEEKNDRRTGLG